MTDTVMSDVPHVLRHLTDQGNEFAALALAHVEIAGPDEIAATADAAALDIATVADRVLFGYSDAKVDANVSRDLEPDLGAVLRPMMEERSPFAALAAVRVVAAEDLKLEVDRIRTDCKAVVDSIQRLQDAAIDNWLSSTWETEA